jgi:hypothetical protein
MFFTACGRLAEQHPDLASVFEQLDSILKAMGTAEVIRPDDLASFLNIDPNQMRSALEMSAQEGILLEVELIECSYCQMAAFRPDYQEARDEDDEYRCTDCGRRLTDKTIQTITAYRYDPRSLAAEDVSQHPILAPHDEGELRIDSAVLKAAAGHGGADPERLIRGKDYVTLTHASQYLELNQDHVRRLVKNRKLKRVGQGRPLKISVKSLRDYKCG